MTTCFLVRPREVSTDVTAAIAGASAQASLFDIPDFTPDLRSYDIILVSISGGKDSQTALRKVVRLCIEQGIPLSRIVCVYADLGNEVTWSGTEEMARYHAESYGLRFITVAKQTKTAAGKRTQGLLERIEIRGHWPSPENRWCTSDFKRGPIGTVITLLAGELRQAWRLAGQPVRQVRVLSVMGIRAEESPKRRKMEAFVHGETPRRRKDGALRVDPHHCNGVRVVDEWLPIHQMTLGQVWADIRASKLDYHYAYHLVGRLSCILCIFAPRKALIAAARANLGKAQLHAEAETRMAARKIATTAALAGAVLHSGYLLRDREWDALRKLWRTHGRFREHLSLVEVYLEALQIGPLDVTEIRKLPLAEGWAA